MAVKATEVPLVLLVLLDLQDKQAQLVLKALRVVIVKVIVKE